MRACPPKTPDTGSCGHGVAADGPDAAALALNSGTDSEMVSTFARDYGKKLLAQRRVSMSRIDDAVRRILRVKFRAGLFEHPYVDVAKAQDPASFVTADDRAAARKAAGRSMVLLKNDGPTLPLSTSKKTAVIGPLGNNKHDMLGPVVGPRRRRGRRDRVRRHQGAEPEHDVHAGLHAVRTPSRRRTTRRPTATRTTASPRRRPRRRMTPTRSCSRSARRAR